MSIQILISVILFTTISGQNYYEWYFTGDEESLMICIENNEYLEDVKNLQGFEIVHTFATLAAKELTKQINANATVIESVIESFRSRPDNSLSKLWNEDLESALIDALIYCSDDYNVKMCSDFNHHWKVPDYKSELIEPEYTRLVNLALSSWPKSLRTMVTTPGGFHVLRRFAEDFVSAIHCAHQLTSSSNGLRLGARHAWEQRVFEETKYLTKKKCPLFLYHYNASDGWVYTCGCAEDTRNYDRRVSYEEYSSVARLFQSHPSGRHDGVYQEYVDDGMRGYEFHYERHSVQNYRVVFFFFELRVRGIFTDHSRIDQVFIDGLPEDLLTILHDDDAYIEYLTNLEEFFLEVNLRNHLEEDMIMYLNSEVNLPGNVYANNKN